MRLVLLPVLLAGALVASPPDLVPLPDPGPSNVPPANPGPVVADALLVNGRFWTLDKSRPQVTALAVWQGRILAVGDAADLRPLAGPGTRLIDLKGRRVLPGFHDSHIHLLATGQRLSQVDLKDARDEAEFGRRLRDFDRKLPAGRWLQGGLWDHDRTFGGMLPTAALLDKYVPNRPAFLTRYDGHMALANSRALQLAGITAATPDPPGGVIYRQAGGKEPTGLLRESAMGLVASLVPAPSEAEIAEAVQAALAELRRHGVTSIDDIPGATAGVRRVLFRLYQHLARSGKLTVRVRFCVPLGARAELEQIGVEVNLGGQWVQIGFLKDFIDGSLGSSTAKMFAPYRHEPGSTGLFVRPLSRLRDDVLAADRAGLAVGVHAIGDRGNAEMLDIFAEAIKMNGPRDRRFRVEHAQHLRPQDIKRFAGLGVIASMQPYHAIDDGRWAEGRIGAERCATSYAFRDLLDAGAKLAFGSDAPVAPVSPLLGIDAAVNRRTPDGKHPAGWFPRQRIRVEEAVEAYTLGAAYASFREKEVGTLTPGKLADLVVLSRDILAESERDHIAETEVVLTMVGGRVVYEKRE
jgi:predicted amidohydrolase YtcJ